MDKKEEELKTPEISKTKVQPFAIAPKSSSIVCGIAWDFFGDSIDLDLSILVFDHQSVELGAAYGSDNALNDDLKKYIVHSGDNQDGKNDGDDESCEINLLELSKNTKVHAIYFLVTIATNDKSFKNVETGTFRILDSDKKECYSYQLVMGYDGTAILIGCIYRNYDDNGQWYFQIVEKIGRGKDLKEAHYLVDENLEIAFYPGILIDRPHNANKTYQLTKQSNNYVFSNNIQDLRVGLGWDPADSGRSIDVDGSVIILDMNKKKISDVYFRNKTFANDAIKHYGDNLTGKGDGDDEVIDIHLNKLPSDVYYLIIAVNIFSGSSNFSQIKNCFVKLYNQNNNHVLCEYKLSNMNYVKSGIVMSYLSKRRNGNWGLVAVGEGADGQKCTDETFFQQAVKMLNDTSIKSTDLSVVNANVSASNTTTNTNNASTSSKQNHKKDDCCIF